MNKLLAGFFLGLFFALFLGILFFENKTNRFYEKSFLDQCDVDRDLALKEKGVSGYCTHFCSQEDCLYEYEGNTVTVYFVKPIEYTLFGWRYE